MMYQPKVKVDCDNILNNMVEAMVDMYNRDNKTRLDYNACTAYDFSCYGTYFMDWTHNLWYNNPSRLWEAMRPPENAEKGLKKLCNNYDVVIVTAAFPWTFKYTCDYIGTYYPWFPQDRIIRCIEKPWVITDYAIDDLPSNLMMDVQATRIMMDVPWNRGFDEVWHDTYRVIDLVDAYDLITDFEKKSDIGGDDFYE